MELKTLLKPILVTPELEAQVDAIPKAVGSYGYDPWGFHRDGLKIGLAIFKWLYDYYFRVEAHGLEHVPPRGRALIIPNHSGQLPLDGALIGVALATNPHGPRAARAMIERFLPTVPFVGNLLNELGGALGDPLNCRRMLEAEEAVIVFPEGVRGSGKLYSQRYQLQRFGTGFMHLAIDCQAPIVPVGVVGCEETMPSLADIRPLARLLHLPYFPLTVPVPLPAKVILHFGEPMTFNRQEGDTEDDIIRKVEQVRRAIRALIKQGLAERQGVF